MRRKPTQTPRRAWLPPRRGDARPGMGTGKKVILAGLIIAIVMATYYIRSGQGFGIDYLKEHFHEIEALARERHLVVLLVFTAIYTVYVGCFLPGTAALSLAGGALFGLGEGMVSVGAARAVGAVMAMLISRYFLRDWVTERHEPFIAKLNQTLERDGAYYLFFLRMAPVVPYNLTNLGLGVTGMPVWTYTWVTAIGMLPRTFLWVNAGNQLAAISTFHDVVSPKAALSLAALGIFPLVMKWVFAQVEKRRKRTP